MKKKSVKVLASCAALAVSLMASSSASAAASDVIYDNTTTYLTNFFASANEFGDQVNFAGTSRLLTDVSFEYFANLTSPPGQDTAVFRLYKNAPGASGIPTDLLYQTPSFVIGNGFNHINISALSIQVPDSVTWTVQFSGLSAGETAGLPLYSPPTVGASLAGGVIGSYDDFWQNSGGTWSLFRFPNGQPEGNFAAKFSASAAAVPEASTFVYAMLGGLMILGCRIYRRHSLRHS
jgi:hypothetical protein